MRKVLFSTILSCLLLPAVFGQTVRLEAGGPRRFTIPPQSQPTLLTGITVAVPPGVTRLTIDLTPDVLSNDLDLFARFGQDVAQFGSLIIADSSSQTPGPGHEQIVISSHSRPPLQTGLYYLGINVITLSATITGSITVTIEGGGSTGTFILSSFDRDADGWTRNFALPAPAAPGASQGNPGSTLAWLSSGGSPDGYLSLMPAGGLQQDFVVAPPKFLGNWAAMTNPRLEFDYLHASPQDALFPVTVRLLGGGAVYQWTSAAPPAGAWTHYRVAVNGDNFKLASSAASLALALSNVQRVEVSLDQAPGPDTDGLDNFALMGDLSGGPPKAVPAVPVVSTFDNDTEGWGRSYPPAGVTGAAIGDPPSTLALSTDGGMPGGAIVFNGAGAGDNFFVAPPKFLGNVAAIPNPRLDFDYRHTATPEGVAPIVVRLLGAGSAYRWVGGNPAPTYQHYRVPLDAAFFVPEFGAASFSQVLAVVERIEISAEQTDGQETDSLDNVALVSALTAPLAPTISIAPAPLNFTATAGDPNPAPQAFVISSNADVGGAGASWTAVIAPPASWLSLSAASGGTPARVTVSVSIAGLTPGTYSTTITVAVPGAANPPQAIRVSLTVATPPAPTPRITPGSVVNAASSRSLLAAGALGSLYGSNLGPAEGIAAGFLPGSQTLPTKMQGVRVLVRDASGAPIAEAPLLYISSGQVNFQMPMEVAGRSSVVVFVDNNGQLSAPEAVALAATAPGLFTVGANRAAAQNQDFSLNSPSNPAPRGGILIAYLTGPGPLSIPVPTGQAAPSNPLAQATSPVIATIGGVPATVLFLGLTPGLVGVAQANILAPAEAPVGDQTLLISIGGQAANGALVSIR